MQNKLPPQFQLSTIVRMLLQIRSQTLFTIENLVFRNHICSHKILFFTGHVKSGLISCD